MVQKKAWVALLGLLVVLLMAAPAMADNLTVARPGNEGISLQDWSNSSLNEKYAFLLGMATMVKMEKYWQTNRNESLIDKWDAAFDGPTFKQIAGKVDDYVLANPDKMNEYLLQVLWQQIVAPKLADKAVK